MSIETSKKLETYKGIKKKQEDIEQIFAELKFNKKKPKYNYHSGLIAGMMINNMVLLRPIIESKKPDQEIVAKIMAQIVPMAKDLVENYNWNMGNLTDLAEQFFGEDKSN